MNENDNAYYDSEKRRFPILKLLLIIIFIVLIIILLVLMFSGKKSNAYDDLLNSAKAYLNTNTDKKPNSVGECSIVYLKDINTENKKSLKNCNSDNTYVKVCKIDEDNYQYTTVLGCINNKTEFGNWTVGLIDELKQGNSDVEFRFIPEQKLKGEKIYYPDDEKNSNKVNTYYIESPKEGYNKIDDPTVAYKWYIDVTGKDYYNNGEYVPTEPSDYPNKDDSKINAYGSLTKPATEGYRTIEEGTIYAKEYVAYPYKYECVDSKIEGTIITPVLCEARSGDKFKTTKKIHFTCDGKTEVEENTICKEKQEWLVESCYDKKQTSSGTTKEGYSYTINLMTGLKCISTKGYIVKDQVSRWYKEGEVKKYYPSQSTIEKDETTYYVNVPSSGYFKAEDTKSYAYKYYKFNENKNGVETWVSLLDKSLTEEEMINAFNNAGYNVESLDDINNNENIRYRVEISYRNRK